MKKGKKTNVAQLKERVERNFEDYKKSMSDLGVEFMFSFAENIANICEVRGFLIDGDYVSEDEAAFLLTFEMPLIMLADDWFYHKMTYGGDFGGFVTAFIETGDMSDYKPVTVADELREKHGEDTPLITACLLELVEMMKTMFGMVDAAAEELERAFNYEDDEGVDI